MIDNVVGFFFFVVEVVVVMVSIFRCCWNFVVVLVVFTNCGVDSDGKVLG